MAEEKVEPREINFRALLPWTELFRGFQVALDPKKLLAAAAGILITAFGWWLFAYGFYTAQSTPPQWPKGYHHETEEQKQQAWETYKKDLAQWNLLHQAAGDVLVYEDAGDLASNPKEYDDKAKALADKTLIPKAKPHGKLRSWPFWEDRGPNPYLLVTNQSQKFWEPSATGDHPLVRQGGVLIEPLVKFFSPVVYLLKPGAGGWNRLYFLLVTLWTLATWAFFGGAITRMASVQIARNEKIGLNEALRFVCARYFSFLSGPVFPLLAVVIIIVLLDVFGLILMIPVLGEVVGGILWGPIVLLAGLAMAVILVGLVGWPMMYATISAEGSDSFDAISRSYSYVYQNPWHYIWYCIVALAYGAVVVFFVGFMGSLTIYLGKWAIGLNPLMPSERDPAYLFVWAPDSFGWRALLLQDTQVGGRNLVENGVVNDDVLKAYINGGDAKQYPFTIYNWIGTALVTFWLWLTFLCVVGFGYSYFWTASTIIYLLMRRKVDDTDMDEVYLEEDDLEEPYGAGTPGPAAAAPPGSAGTPLTMVEPPALRPPSPAPPKSEAPKGEGGNPPPTGGPAS